MSRFHIRQGKDLRIKGAAMKEIRELPIPAKVAVQPADLRGLKLRPLVKENDLVKVGTPLLEDKFHPEIKIVSPASGRITSLLRGEKRLLLQIIIETDAKQEPLGFHKSIPDELSRLPRQTTIDQLLLGGLWPAIRQRPFSKVANPQDRPKAIFIHAMNTEPLALDVDFLLTDKQFEFQAGLDIMKTLTAGAVHLCFAAPAQSKALTEAKRVESHQFSGPHPAGNVSTHIHYVDPIKKGDIVWYLEAQDVLRVADLFLKGIHSPVRYAALTGSGLEKRNYVKTISGASIASLLPGHLKETMRYISGSILTGKNAGLNGFLGFYDSQITVIPEGGTRRFLGWLAPGFNRYSFSKTFVSSFLPEKETALDTDKQGSDRAIVLNHIYDQYVPLEILTFFLLRAVIAGDIEEAEKLGILECDEEDFALCSFACPSKTDVGGIIREGLDLIEKEG